MKQVYRRKHEQLDHNIRINPNKTKIHYRMKLPVISFSLCVVVLHLSLNVQAFSVLLATRSAPRSSTHRLSHYRTTSTARSRSERCSLYAEQSDTATSLFDNYSQEDPNQPLAFKDTVVGTGEEAQAGKIVTVAYVGRLMSADRKQFDQGAGFSFRLGAGKVIPGWDRGLVGMKVGGKRILRIPPGLAYGNRGAKGVIPPGAHIEFECELKDIPSNPITEAYAQLNWQPERSITFVLLCILLAAATYMK